MRNPGKRLLDLAAERVKFSPGQVDAVLSRLTPDEELCREFPRLDTDTPYGFFSAITNSDAVIYFTGADSEEDRKRVVEEAALGMRDNQLFD